MVLVIVVVVVVVSYLKPLCFQLESLIAKDAREAEIQVFFFVSCSHRAYINGSRAYYDCGYSRITLVGIWTQTV